MGVGFLWVVEAKVLCYKKKYCFVNTRIIKAWHNNSKSA